MPCKELRGRYRNVRALQYNVSGYKGLKGIIIYFILHGLQITANSVFTVYQGIFHVCERCESVNFPLFERSERCVAHFLVRISYTLELFRSN